MAAPLVAGNDLRSMSQATRDILTAPEVIAVDQDVLGIQGIRVSEIGASDKPEVWSKILSGENTRAVVLFNRSEEAVEITVTWNEIGLPSGPAKVRDLWYRVDRGVFSDRYTAYVLPHGVVLVKILSTGGNGPSVTPAV
jgi:alpha-galactosidase